MKELSLLCSGILVGVAGDYLFRAKALAEYAALKNWVRGEVTAVPAWFQKELAEGGERASTQLKQWAQKL